MFRRVDDFLTWWNAHYKDTLKVFEQFTDASLSTRVAADHRTIGRIAWHIVQTIPEMCGEVGLEIDGPAAEAPVPATAAELCEVYRRAAASLHAEVKATWSDETLEVEDELYGETWKRGFTLLALVAHEVHHRGQLTVLMRQAGLSVPGTYGPSRDEWANLGMPPPAV